MVGLTPTLAKTKFSTSTTNKKKDKLMKKSSKPSPINEQDEQDIGNISGISPIKSPVTKRRVVYEDKKTVSLKLKQDKQLRLQIVELENRLKRAENDTVSCKARVNSLKTQIQEKDRHIRDLELKLPRVLADISRSVGTNAVLTRNNTKNVRESMKRNHQLNLKVRELEQELRLKEKGEEKSNTHLNTIKVENIKLKAENCRLKADNTKLKAESKLAETAAREFRGVTDEKNKLTELLAELQQENTRLQDSIETKELESKAKISELVEENSYLYQEISEHYDELLRTEADLEKVENVVFSIVRCHPELREGFNSEALSFKQHRCNVTWPPGFSDKIVPGHLQEELNDHLQNLFGQDEFEDPFSNEVEDVEEGQDVLCYSFQEDQEEDLINFEDSQEKSIFYSRVEDLDFKLEILLNKLNSTISSRS